MTGDEIESIRKMAGWYQYDLANFLGTTQPTVNRAEKILGRQITVGAMAGLLYQDLLYALKTELSKLPKSAEIGKPEAGEPFILSYRINKRNHKLRFTFKAVKA